MALSLKDLGVGLFCKREREKGILGKPGHSYSVMWHTGSMHILAGSQGHLSKDHRMRPRTPDRTEHNIFARFP